VLILKVQVVVAWKSER